MRRHLRVLVQALYSCFESKSSSLLMLNFASIARQLLFSYCYLHIDPVTIPCRLGVEIRFRPSYFSSPTFDWGRTICIHSLLKSKPHSSTTKMNPFANSTNHFNHSEPILAAPTSGTCSLLAGFEKDNITRNLFQPCCSSAVAVGYERSTCKSETGWETCFGQHREDSSLIAAVCSTSGTISRR